LLTIALLSLPPMAYGEGTEDVPSSEGVTSSRAGNGLPIDDLQLNTSTADVDGVRGTGPAGPGRMFYIHGNNLSAWDVTNDTHKLVAKVTYSVDGSGGLPAESQLQGMEVSNFGNGSFHIGFLERQPLNNQTALFLVTMIVSKDLVLVRTLKPFARNNVSHIQVVRNMVLVQWTNDTGGQAEDALFYVEGIGYKDNYMGALGWHHYSIVFDETTQYFDILTARDNCAHISFISEDGSGGVGVSPDQDFCGSDTWIIHSMVSRIVYNGTNSIRVNAAVVDETAANCCVHPIVYWSREGRWFNGGWDWADIGHGIVYNGDLGAYPPLDEELGFDADPCLAHISFHLEAGSSGGPPVGLVEVALNGTVVNGPKVLDYIGGAVHLEDADGPFYISSVRSNQGGPKDSILVQIQGVNRLYGDWAVSDIAATGPSADILVGDMVNVTFQTGVSKVQCNATCLEGATLDLLVDGVKVPGQEVVLMGNYTSATVAFNWTPSSGGQFNLTVRASVAKDKDFSNNNISVLVDVLAYPDLTIKNLTVDPARVHPGQAYNVTFDIINMGDLSAAAKATIALNGTDVWNRSFLPLAPGGLMHAFGGPFLATGLVPGIYDISVNASSLGLPDQNLSNNGMEATLEVYLRAISLQLTSPKAGDTVNHALPMSGTVTDPEGGYMVLHSELRPAGKDKPVASSPNISASGPFSTSMDISMVPTGDYDLVVTASGTGGRTASATVHVKVLNGPYWAKLEPADAALTVSENSSVAVRAAAMDYGTGRPLVVEWRLDGKDARTLGVIVISGENLSYTPTFSDQGTHVISAVASDTFGRIERTWNVTVRNVDRPPVLQWATPNNATLTVKVGEAVNLSALAIDPDGDNLNYSWKYWNGTLTGTIISVRPGKAGNYTVTLTVSDGELNVTRSWLVHVLPREIAKPHKLHTTDMANMWPLWVVLVAVAATVGAIVVYRRLEGRKAGKD
jgi:hypothetical protein